MAMLNNQVVLYLDRQETDNYQWTTPNHCLDTGSTTQGGGGSFRDGKPIWELGCCDSWMAEWTHWWIERRLERPAIYLSVYPSLDLSIDLSIHPSIYPSIYRSSGGQKAATSPRCSPLTWLTFWQFNSLLSIQFDELPWLTYIYSICNKSSAKGKHTGIASWWR